MKKQESTNSIDAYIAACPDQIRETLIELRNTIRKAAPLAEEKISYQMPAFAQKGILVYFAAQKEHIGFYPTSSGVEAFKKELSDYSISKGVVRFPYGKPLPLKLISEIVRFRVIENLEKDKLKSRKKSRNDKIK